MHKNHAENYSRNLVRITILNHKVLEGSGLNVGSQGPLSLEADIEPDHVEGLVIACTFLGCGEKKIKKAFYFFTRIALKLPNFV
jgi:hypothetical protein